MPDLSSVLKGAGLSISEDALEKLAIYDRLLIKWQGAINLISETTIQDRFNRHFLDSAQLMKFIPDRNIRLADLGSGAGFPGMVLAILGISDVHLIESDVRKATFLREVSRETNTPVTIHDRRAEQCKIEDVDFFTARALAPLRELLGMFDHLRTKGRATTCLLLKGAQWQEELDKARKKWDLQAELFESLTEQEARVIKISTFSPKS